MTKGNLHVGSTLCETTQILDYTNQSVQIAVCSRDTSSLLLIELPVIHLRENETSKFNLPSESIDVKGSKSKAIMSEPTLNHLRFDQRYYLEKDVVNFELGIVLHAATRSR